MKLNTSLLVITSAIFLYSCSAKPHNDKLSKDEVAPLNADAVAANLNSPDRKIIKTADVSARVVDVYDATRQLEQATRQLEGMVMESTMENQIGRNEDLPYLTDSIKRVRTYTTTSHLTIRIPVAYVDSFMSYVAS